MPLNERSHQCMHLVPGCRFDSRYGIMWKVSTYCINSLEFKLRTYNINLNLTTGSQAGQLSSSKSKADSPRSSLMMRTFMALPCGMTKRNIARWQRGAGESALDFEDDDDDPWHTGLQSIGLPHPRFQDMRKGDLNHAIGRYRKFLRTVTHPLSTLVKFAPLRFVWWRTLTNIIFAVFAHPHL